MPTPWKRLVEFLPPLATYEREQLKESIRRYGVRQPIIVRNTEDEEIIDGRHRFEIAQELGLSCPKISVDLDEDDAFTLGVSLNLDRRQLGPEQIKKIREGQKKIALELRKQGKTQEEVAKITGLPQSTISELESKVESNIVTNIGADNAHNVFPDLRTKIPKTEHKKIFERYKKGETQQQIAADYKVDRSRIARIIKKEEKAQQEQQSKPKPKIFAQLKQQDAVAFLNSVPDKSVDLLLTDPPYSTEFKDFNSFVDFVNSWLYKALNKLKDTGQAYIFIGAYAWEILAYLTALKKVEERYGEPQILVWTYKNTLGPDNQYKYLQNWQAIIYIRAPQAPKINETQLTRKLAVMEFNAPDARNGTRYHTWEKPLDLAKRLIEQSTTSEAFIIDPFAGTGTFLLAASELGRANIGSENDEKMVEIAVKRGCVKVE
jgi:ParB/RepB/Spo0J family partition protein